MTVDRAFRQTYRMVLLAVMIAFVLIGGLIGAFGTRKARVEGIAERWATAVSDTTRKGMLSDARTRVKDHGDPLLVGVLVDPSVDHHHKGAFASLEVGKATRPSADVALVPLKVEYREPKEGTTARRVLTLDRTNGTWRVVAVADATADPSLSVPSDGGPAVTRAPITLYAGTLALGALISLGCASLIRAAGPEQSLGIA